MAGTDKGVAPVLPAYPPLPAANRRYVVFATETEGMNDQKGPMRRRPQTRPLKGGTEAGKRACAFFC